MVVAVAVTVGGSHVSHITRQSFRTDVYMFELLSVHAPCPKTRHSLGSKPPLQFGASSVVVVTVDVVSSQLSQSTLQFSNTVLTKQRSAGMSQPLGSGLPLQVAVVVVVVIGMHVSHLTGHASRSASPVASSDSHEALPRAPT